MEGTLKPLWYSLSPAAIRTELRYPHTSHHPLHPPRLQLAGQETTVLGLWPYLPQPPPCRSASCPAHAIVPEPNPSNVTVLAKNHYLNHPSSPNSRWPTAGEEMSTSRAQSAAWGTNLLPKITIWAMTTTFSVRDVQGVPKWESRPNFKAVRCCWSNAKLLR